MKQHLYKVLMIILSACGTSSSDKNGMINESGNTDSATGLYSTVPSVNSLAEDTSNIEYATFFVVVADTSPDYYILQTKMFDLYGKLNIPVDTMGRFYNKSKNLIALPDNDEDEMYAGDYFPRRFPSDNMSLEYLNIYQSNAGEKTIALVTGIYETEKSADSALKVIQKGREKSL